MHNDDNNNGNDTHDHDDTRSSSVTSGLSRRELIRTGSLLGADGVKDRKFCRVVRAGRESNRPRSIVPIALIAMMSSVLFALSDAQAQDPFESAPEPYVFDGDSRDLPLAGPSVMGDVVPLVEQSSFGYEHLYLGIVQGTWTDQGPGPTTNAQVQNLSPNNEVAGAIHAVVAHPTNANILYIGAVNGGVWRTMNATAASPMWTPLTDLEQSLSISALEMDPANAMILLAGTGRFSSFGGDPPFQVAGGDLSGLLRTSDGGTTWTPITDPLLVGEHISSVASRGSTLLAGANDFFGGGGVGGLFRSTDTGATWTQITGAGTGLPFGTIDDLGGDPSVTSRLYGALQGNGIYRTDDTGANWTQVSNNDATLNLAMLGSTNTRIAVAGDSRVFVLVTSGGTVRYIGFSDDTGATWTQMDIPGTVETPLRGRDELMSMVTDPSDSDIVYVAAISQVGNPPPPPPPAFPNSVGATSFHAHMFRGDVTRARGLTGNVSNQWDHLTHATGNALMPNGGTATTSSPHADSREMAFDANGNLIEVDDGGVNRRTNPGNNTGDWFSINGDIQVTELHSIAYDTNFNIIIGGTQDTGTVEQTGTGSTTWNSVSRGDGGKVAVDDSVGGTSVRYSSFQRLQLFRRRTCIPACATVFPALAGGVPALVTGTGGNVQFYTPIELNTANPIRLIIGASNDVYESMDQGNTVSTIPDGGVILRANSDAAMVYGHPNNAELIYVGSGIQVFVRTTAGGNLAATTGAFPGGRVFGVAVDPANANIVYANGNASVFQSVDGGANWTNITGNITDDGAGTFRAIEYIPSATGDRLAVGTNAGVLVSFFGSFGNWSQLGTVLPNAPVWDLDYDATDDVLVAGTLGRGAWTLANISTLKLPVAIDIKPGSDPNSINPKSMGVVPVAILGSDSFDVTIIDVSTLAFGPSGALPRHDLTDPVTYANHLQDVNLDTFIDLVSHYRQKETGLSSSDTEGCISGDAGGSLFEGCDAVRVLNK